MTNIILSCSLIISQPQSFAILKANKTLRPHLSKGEKQVHQCLTLLSSMSGPQISTTKGGEPPSEPTGGDTPDNANFQRSIDSRQMVFLALAGGIGAGLFVASGSALSAGGPGSALINYALVGMMVCTTMGALGELASTFPPFGSLSPARILSASCVSKDGKEANVRTGSP